MFVYRSMWFFLQYLRCLPIKMSLIDLRVYNYNYHCAAFLYVINTGF